MERFLNEIFLISQVFANLGDDIRHLQASAIREISSSSSTSSTMSHKGSNPVVAEQIDGMCISVRGEFLKVLESGNSTLQRDLRYSNVMRGYAAILVFTFKQLESATTVLDSLSVDETMCRENFSRSGRLVTAELLHLSLQENGFPDAHRFVNKVIVPRARESGNNLVGEMQCYLAEHTNKKLGDAWSKVSLHIREVIEAPERYIGDAIEIADKEGRNFLI